MRHDHAPYRPDNATGYAQLVIATLGTQYVSMIVPYKQDKNGKWRLNGRMTPNPVGTATFEASQKLSQKEKDAYKKELQQVKTELAILGKYGGGGFINLEESAVVGRIKADAFQSNWRSRSNNFFVVDPEVDADLSSMVDGDTKLLNLVRNWIPVVRNAKMVVHKSKESIAAVSRRSLGSTAGNIFFSFVMESIIS